MNESGPAGDAGAAGRAQSPASVHSHGTTPAARRGGQHRDAHDEAGIAAASMIELVCWRHPRCDGATGRCIGRTDLALDGRRAKRLAHRIRAAARRAHWPRLVQTSPLQRGADVGRWLRRWGWRHVVDERLAELDFGTWDGRAWSEIAPAEIAAWSDALADHAPGGGESLRALVARVQAFLAARRDTPGPLLLVTHAGWMEALRCLQSGRLPDAAHWPAPPPHGVAQRHLLTTMRPDGAACDA